MNCSGCSVPSALMLLAQRPLPAASSSRHVSPFPLGLQEHDSFLCDVLTGNSPCVGFSTQWFKRTVVNDITAESEGEQDSTLFVLFGNNEEEQRKTKGLANAYNKVLSFTLQSFQKVLRRQLTAAFNRRCIFFLVPRGTEMTFASLQA